jgi:large subunit ribosomal protein L24e
VKCSFSGEEIEPGTGIMYVRKDGSVLHYKNRMCMRNHQGLGRTNRYTRWTQAAREAKADRLAHQ